MQLQVFCAITSVGLCGVHIFRLIEIGFYLIEVRPDVDKLNKYIKEEQEIEEDEL